DYGDRARFIHIEVWRDFEASELDPAAREWIARGGDAREPWVFLIGADGKVAARWDNVATRPEIEPRSVPPASQLDLLSVPRVTVAGFWDASGLRQIVAGIGVSGQQPAPRLSRQGGGHVAVEEAEHVVAGSD
ncbi:MAG: hypothetical protein ACRDHS_09450, partial [Actinomycetota bacterium]